MPEGDTVRLAASRLHRALADQVVLRSDFRVPQHATADVAGARVLDFSSYGKHLLCRFDSGLTLHTHLRMDGSWHLLAPGRRPVARLDSDVRVVLLAGSGTTAVGLRLPVVDLVPTSAESALIGHLGPDILAPDFDEAEAVRRLTAGAGRPAVAALLDQRNLAGIGNMWAGETLFLRGVHPWTAIDEVDATGLVRLARRMMTYALTHPGQVTTGDTRRGQTHWVYGRAGQPCRRCGTAIALRRPAGGDPYERETWWCPSCQPERCA
jgi:endonuclease-8